ncbi:hypothetical protein D3C83_80560 [compost metagenome]
MFGAPAFAAGVSRAGVELFEEGTVDAGHADLNGTSATIGAFGVGGVASGARQGVQCAQSGDAAHEAAQARLGGWIVDE